MLTKPLRLSIALALVSIAATSLLASTVPARASAGAPRPAWEYRVLGDITNLFGETVGTSVAAMNQAGLAGWEAVGIYGNGATLMKRRLD